MLQTYLKRPRTQFYLNPTANMRFPQLGHQLFTPKNGIEDKKLYDIPELPLLDAIIDVTKKNLTDLELPDLSKTIIVCVQHILETTVTLIKALIKLGIQPENIYMTGKCYSNSPIIENILIELGVHLVESYVPIKPGEFQETFSEQINELWNVVIHDLVSKNVDRIIVLDDGGRALESIPNALRFAYPIAGIEQTRGGLYSTALDTLPFSLIEVASSATKRQLEAPLVAEVILNKIKERLGSMPLDENMVCGVIGNGAIGTAIAKYLLSRGCKVVIYDDNENAFTKIKNRSFYRLASIRDVIAGSSYIFGCTGRDITKDIDIFSIVKNDKVFISCSSEDTEFLSLLKNVAAHLKSSKVDPLSDIVYQLDNRTSITIAGGGYPINFDRSPRSVSASKIALTRGLLLVACIQAIRLAKRPINDGYTINRHTRLCLNIEAQSYVATAWLFSQRDQYASEDIECFQDKDWVKNNSGGTYHPDDFMTKCFSTKPIEYLSEQLTTVSRSAKM